MLAFALLKRLRRQRTPAATATERATDTELIELFRNDGDRAWNLFLDRHADFILSVLRHLGFDHDEAMDRFVFVCEKLAEDRYRRLRTVQFAGRDGELIPWLRTVVRNLAVSWAWSVDGRRRLFRSIEELPHRAQRVFELYFWQGMPPSNVYEALLSEGRWESITFKDVLEDLELIYQHLDAGQRWRLMSRLIRGREALSVGVEDPQTGLVFEPPANDDGPEAMLLRSERRAALERELETLAARDRLILQLRYEESLSLAEIARIVRVSVSTVKGSLRASRQRLADELVDWRENVR